MAEKRLNLSHSSRSSSANPLEQLLSAFCGTEEGDSLIDDLQDPRFCQAIPAINQTKTTSLSILNPHLWRNEKSNVNIGKIYWSPQGSVVSLDHSKLLVEATQKLLVEATQNSEAIDQTQVSLQLNTQSQNIFRASGGRPSSTKKRIKWTVDLHEKFVNCVNQLGGPEKATPMAILKLMKSNGLTIHHIKSHLQKYRCAKYFVGSTRDKPDQKGKAGSDDYLPMLYWKNGLQVKEIVQKQLELQSYLCQQLEIQQNLQQAIVEQGKQMRMMLEQLKETKRVVEDQILV